MVGEVVVGAAVVGNVVVGAAVVGAVLGAVVGVSVVGASVLGVSVGAALGELHSPHKFASYRALTSAHVISPIPPTMVSGGASQHDPDL